LHALIAIAAQVANSLPAYLLRYANRIKHRGNIAPRLCQHAVTNEP